VNPWKSVKSLDILGQNVQGRNWRKSGTFWQSLDTWTLSYLMSFPETCPSVQEVPKMCQKMAEVRHIWVLDICVQECPRIPRNMP